MTMREWMMVNHPQEVGDYSGRVRGCPHNYGIEHKTESFKNCTICGGEGCGYCWGREMPGTAGGDDDITASEYQRLALRTANGDGDGDRDLPLYLNGVLGLAGESGECADIVKKHLFQGHALDKEHLAKELGDVAWYLAVTAHAIGYDLGKIFRMNIEKLRKRYPDGFDADRSVNRQEGDV